MVSILDPKADEQQVEKATDHATSDVTDRIIPALEAMLNRVLDGFTVTITVTKKKA